MSLQHRTTSKSSGRKKPAADFGVVAGRFAPATTARGYHPLVARREEPHNKRIERMSTGPSKLEPAATAHPRAVRLIFR
jgi:hypothetical protein